MRPSTAGRACACATPSGYTQSLCATYGALCEPASAVCAEGRCFGASLAAVAVREHDGGIYCGED